MAEYDQKHADVDVKVVGGINDDKIFAALRSGNVPDIVSSFMSSNVGIFCPSGGWIDLGPLLKRDHIDVNHFPATSRYYTQYKGTRCALPLLADATGLYYNTALFKKAGLTGPPKTLSQLATYAKKLTVKNKDGSIKTLGYDPNMNFYLGGYGNGASGYQPLIGASYFDKSGQVEPRHRPRVGEPPPLAEAPDRLLRLRQPRPLAGRRRRRVRTVPSVRDRASSR